MSEEIIREVQDRFGEYLEMAGKQSDHLMMIVLAQMVKIERQKNHYLNQLAYQKKSYNSGGHQECNRRVS